MAQNKIRGMAALSTAASVLSSGGRETKEIGLMQLASRLEHWISRPLWRSEAAGGMLAAYPMA